MPRKKNEAGKGMTKMRCQACAHDWYTASMHIYVTCPNCMTKVQNPSFPKKKKGEAIEH